MRSLALLSVLAVVVGASAQISVPMDQQINLGYTYNSQSPSGDAIYVPSFSGTDTQTIYADGALEPEGFTRHNLLTMPGTWYYQYVDLNLAGLTTPGVGFDMSAPGSTVTFDTRYFQDPDTNTNPYGDAPVFLRLYTYAADGDTYVGHRDFGIVYATQAPWSDPGYPDWTTVVVDVNTATYTDGGAFDIHKVDRVRWYGTDWANGGNDFVDFKNLVMTPEPTSLVLLALSVLLRRR